MDKEKVISLIEKVKAEEYEVFSKGEKRSSTEVFIAQLAEHSGFQRACDALIQEIKEE